MISSIPSNTQVQPVSTAAPKQQTPAPAAKPAEDTVHLSPQAIAAAKGADHDGDSR
jgi:hypothetical protein